jgi:hypothetical protein
MNRRLFSVAVMGLSVFIPRGQPQANPHGPLRAVARVVGEKYCYSDDEAFLASLKLDVEITNLSRRRVYITSDMIPNVGRVAVSVDAARKLKYVQEWTGTILTSGDANQTSKRLWIEPGRSVLVHSGYGVPASFKARPRVPGTIPPGSYALVLVFHPTTAEPGGASRRRGRIESFVTEPVHFSIPNQVSPRPCE